MCNYTVINFIIILKHLVTGFTTAIFTVVIREIKEDELVETVIKYVRTSKYISFPP